MIKIICDRCGQDCDAVGYDILIRAIHNPIPQHISDKGDLSITCDHESVRMIVCQEYYKELELPNIYRSNVQNSITWSE